MLVSQGHEIAAEESDATLVVIDMQPECFIYARWMVKPVLAQMQEAARQGQGIVLVQYAVGLEDAIAPAILQAFRECPRQALAVKTQEDGSDKVLAACLEANLSTSRFRICGVTTDDCVTKTAHGLALLCPSARIEVIKSACECWQGNRYDWSSFSHLPNVIPV
jgi:nicotinamidase-related amidase